jgi:hypothetical protein
VWGSGLGYVKESFMAIWKETVEESPSASLILRGWRNLPDDERTDRVRGRHVKLESVKSAGRHDVFDIMAEVTVTGILLKSEVTWLCSSFFFSSFATASRVLW